MTRRRVQQVMWALVAILLCVSFSALGSWQLQRRTWKLDLIERVENRVHAPPAPPPERGSWPQVNAAADEYRHLRLEGRYLTGRDTFVQAVTRLGSGFWVLSPFQLSDGGLVLVNRGFLPSDALPVPAPVSQASAGPVVVTGLLRMSEPDGGFLRHNDAASGRWYSRDVVAIAAAHGLQRVAPYFLDADAAPLQVPAGAGQPVGGLTVVAFHNNHLAYALTWYALALMVAGAAVAVAMQNTKRHEDHPPKPLAD